MWWCMVICHLCIMKCLKIPKRIIRSCESKDRHYNTMAKRKRRKELTKTYKTLEKIYRDQFKDSKGIIKIRKSKDRLCINGQKKKDKRTNNDLQNITQKTKDWATQTPLKTEGKLSCSWRVSSSSFTSGTCCGTLFTNLVISHEWWKDRIVICTIYICTCMLFLIRADMFKYTGTCILFQAVELGYLARFVSYTWCTLYLSFETFYWLKFEIYI